VPRRIAAAGAAAGVLALVLSGCVGTPAPTSTPSASSPAPIFASDEEALAAAVEAYELYSSASAEVTADGGAEAERVDPTVTQAYAVKLHDEFDALEDVGLTMVGTTKIEDAKLAESGYDEQGASVSIYFCRDVSGVRVIGEDGADVTPSDREDRTPTQAFFVSSSDDPAILLVDGVEQWSGEDFC
jgi:hypothetical protein